MFEINGGTIVDGGSPSDHTVSVGFSVGHIFFVCSYDSTSNCSLAIATLSNYSHCLHFDLTISKTVDNQEPMIGETVTLTVTISNSLNDFESTSLGKFTCRFIILICYDSIGMYNIPIHHWTIDVLPTDGACLIIRAEVFLGDGGCW
jgi:hypothetical protein